MFSFVNFIRKVNVQNHFESNMFEKHFKKLHFYCNYIHKTILVKYFRHFLIVCLNFKPVYLLTYNIILLLKNVILNIFFEKYCNFPDWIRRKTIFLNHKILLEYYLTLWNILGGRLFFFDIYGKMVTVFWLDILPMHIYT